MRLTTGRPLASPDCKVPIQVRVRVQRFDFKGWDTCIAPQMVSMMEEITMMMST